MSSRQRHAFTLVELLVVIGIIGVLISILLPALQRARQSARQVSCLSQIRQCGLAVLAYVNENNGRFPPLWATAPNLDYSVWNNWISMVITPKRYNESGVQISPTAGTGHQLFRCPSFVADTGNERVDRTYMMNVSEWGSDSFPWQGLPGMKITQVKSPATKAMLFDIWYIFPNDVLPLFKPDTTSWSGYHDSVIPFASEFFNKAPHSSKSDKATNIAFVDGHCERVQYVPSSIPGNENVLPQEIHYAEK